MSENTAAPGEPQPEPADAGAAVPPQPQYAARIPSAPGVPPWHPEANAEQRAAIGVPPVPTAPGFPGQAVPAAYQAPQEDVLRGTLFALVALPLGVLAWMLLWKFGVIASIVTFGVAALAARLYVRGTGGMFSRAGAWVIVSVTAVTFLLAFTGGLWLDVVDYLGGSPLAMAFDPKPWGILSRAMTSPDFLSGISKDFFMALLFGALGCFFTLRRLFAATRNR